MRAPALLFAPLLALLTACSPPTGPRAAGLAGDWTTEREALRPGGSRESRLSLAGDGRFVSESRAYGVYPGQAAEQLSSTSRVAGGYRADGDRLLFRAESLTTYDTFGGREETRVQDPYPYGAVYEGATFRVEGDRLTLTYTTYPADAPVRTSRQFRRTGSGGTPGF